MPKSHIQRSIKAAMFLSKLHDEFTRLLDVHWRLPDDLRDESEKFVNGVGPRFFLSTDERKKRIVSIINAKFRLNQERLKSFYDRAALRKMYFDSHAKEHLVSLFNESDRPGFCQWIDSRGIPPDFELFFHPVTAEDSLSFLRRQMKNATIKRSDARQGVQAERRESILRAIFGGWLFEIADRKRAFALNTKMTTDDVEDNYYQHLQKLYPQMLQRSCGGIVIRVLPDQIEEMSAGTLRAWLFSEIDEAYRDLSNYSYMAFHLRFPKNAKHHGRAWEVANDVTLYAERCQNTKLRAGFFHPEEISAVTIAWLDAIDTAKANFALYQHGFGFRDCIVLCSKQLSRGKPDGQVDSVLMLFEKAVANETPIPCPACRSLNIRGNSYPVFGVRSWECQNIICPERSAFDRGNRFSVMSIFRREASGNIEALIPEPSLRQWKLDVLESRSDLEILEMFVRHYSLPGDKLTVVNWDETPRTYLGRILVQRNVLPKQNVFRDPLVDFEQLPFFHRYLNVASRRREGLWRRVESVPLWLELYQGSCLDVLASLPQHSVDGAVTSPPYYNAREYSSWPNLYCYLYEMKLAAEAVYRVLRPGGYYLFNIFDYFDNDNIVAFSSLGKRRLVLGAYMSQIFRACGFEITGNIVWHKGEIEGKRNYNQGNRAPFYQLPLNTWEHILVLRKPGNEVEDLHFPGAIFRRPVLKWFKGENRHGHTAPFPEEIPDLLCSRLKRGARILDPFAGSLTTAIACHARGHSCIAIELHESYCKLGLEKISHAEQQLALFPQAVAD
jgi:DNA modification methylase